MRTLFEYLVLTELESLSCRALSPCPAGGGGRNIGGVVELVLSCTNTLGFPSTPRPGAVLIEFDRWWASAPACLAFWHGPLLRFTITTYPAVPRLFFFALSLLCLAYFLRTPAVPLIIFLRTSCCAIIRFTIYPVVTLSAFRPLTLL